VRYPRHTSEWRCAVTTVGEGGAIDLEVVAPPAIGRPSSSFPQMTWRQESGRWVARAKLPAAPSFVRLVPAGSTRERWLDAAVLLAAAVAMIVSLVIAGPDRFRGTRGAA
jgi:hypothetical protein